MTDTKKCEHGNEGPWYNCEQCRKDSRYGFTGFAEGGAVFSDKPLVLGENLTNDGQVKT
jgi:hypothetical protein